MSNAFNIGDRVEVIDDNESGIVKKVIDNTITVEFEDGFQQEFQSNQLILSKPLEFDHANMTIAHIDENLSIRKQIFKSSKSNYSPELDLHIHELIDDARRLSNFEILNIQLSRAKGFLDWAISKHFKKSATLF